MAAAAPTGCFKCGRPGHWSRDCPSSSSSAAGPTANPSNPSRFVSSSSSYPGAKRRPPVSAEGDTPHQDDGTNKKKRKKERATRPKLTPDLLLSEDGIGFVLRYFPKAFKPRARPGHEVEDLGNLIKLYTDWHSRFIPYYSFEQFVRKLEKVGASNRVRRCISELRDRVARGGDPTLLREAPVEEVTPTGEPDGTAPEDPFLGSEDNHVANPGHEGSIDPLVEGNTDMDHMQEDLLNEMYEKAADEAPQTAAGEESNKEASEPSAPKEASSHGNAAGKVQEEAGSSKPAKIELTEEQRARMEANRLKALERAAARARASQPA
ncbi:hypothetical protein HU200_039704 [Digitaria exilis]|uniref:CCHC-type domain-containing protein n=1 Tax=Digitaria exilis TaxID=1010633 RepID=A0A835BAJ4_9POAL|nr:hypothetical protein HU200_039704 [Digitaria exilis]CAB3469116.1 unnamed protein product [Digitaria exilis]